MIGQRAKILLLWGIATLFVHIVDRILAYPNQILLKILPNSLLRLTTDQLLALLVTFSASLLAWAIALLLGYSLGLTAAAARLDKRAFPFATYVSNVITKTYEALYIIPFVLTTSLVFAISMSFLGNPPRLLFLVVFALVLAAGFSLGGYVIYKAAYQSTARATRDNLYLVNSLYSRFEKNGSFLAPRLLPFLKARRLIGCEIHQMANAVSQALFLSIVAIMIVESVTPSFYEYLKGSPGPVDQWLKGAGRLIMDAQGSYDFEAIAGFIWAVLFFVWVVDYMYSALIQRKFLRFYGEEQ